MQLGIESGLKNIYGLIRVNAKVKMITICFYYFYINNDVKLLISNPIKIILLSRVRVMLSKVTRGNPFKQPNVRQSINPEQIEFCRLWACCLEIRIIDKLRPCYTFISELYLDHNMLKTLNGIEQFQNLEILSFNFNFIEGFNQLQKIQNKFFIRQISMIANPLQSDPRCSYQQLKSLMFRNLQVINQTVSKSKTSKPIKHYPQLQKTDQYQHFNTQGDEKLTERFHGSYSTDKLETSMKTKRTSRIKMLDSQELHKNLEETQYLKGKIKEKYQKSTAAHHHTNNSAQFVKFNHERWSQKNSFGRNNPNISLNEDIFIQPFIQDQEEKQRVQNLMYGEMSGQFSSHEKQMSQELKIDRTYKQIASEILEQQKMEIAQAFSQRTIKQKVWACLKGEREVQDQAQSQLKRKALSAIKIFTALQRFV